MLYNWLVAAGKAVSYYNEKAAIVKEPRASHECSETQEKAAKLHAIIKENDKTIEELKETNEELKGVNASLKVELKRVKEQYKDLMSLLDVIVDDETLELPGKLSAEIFKY